MVDASVAIKWAVMEPGRDLALTLLEVDDDLVAPDLIFAELANVLRKKLRSGGVSPQQVDLALEAVEQALARTVGANELWRQALDLARTLDHSAYDCFYLARAMTGGTLATADATFRTKCLAEGFRAFLFDASAEGKAARS